MLRPHSGFSRLRFWSAVFTFCLLLAGVPRVYGQAGGVVHLPDNESDVDLDKRVRTQRERFLQLLKGEDAPKAGDAIVMETAAKWYTYRVTWAEMRKSSKLEPLIREFDQQVLNEALKKDVRANNKEFMKLFADQMVVQLRKVLQAELVSRLAGARILVRMGRTGQPQVGDLMGEILDDKAQNEAVKFFALQGLIELFTAAQPKPDAHCIQSLLDFVASKSSLPDNMPLQEADAVRYLRREAIRALGMSRLPALNKGSGTIALVLLREVVKGGVTPAPSVSEQVEAALGVAQLQAKLFPGYQPDYAAFYVGQFMVEFAKNANADRGGSKSEPWKYDAARLGLALEGLKSDSQEGESTKYISDFVGAASPLLKNVESGGLAESNLLRDWLGKNPPKSTSLFKGDDQAVVKPAPE